NSAVETSVAFAGLDGASFSVASNSATIFLKLKDLKDRKGKENSAFALAGQFSQALGSIEDATIFIVAPPAVQGLGNGNDFNMLGRTFRVTAQAEPSARDDLSDVANLKVRSNTGAMVPLGSLADLKLDSGPARVVRYNLFPASELQGSAGPRVSTGQAL